VTRVAVEPVDAPTRELEEPPPGRAELTMRFAVLVVGTVAFLAAIYALGGWAWDLVAVSVFAIIMLHEAGHFVTAKWSGMKATEFFVGFGPRLWSVRRGETEYGVKALPLGGYVKILGMTSLEELDASDEPRSFVNQSTGKRVLVASAGSIVHLLLAFLLAIGALWFIGQPTSTRIQIQGLETSPTGKTPAELAGLRLGDVIVSINNVAITGTAKSEATLESIIHSSPGKPVVLVVDRGGHDVLIRATPEPIDQGSKVVRLGILLGSTHVYARPSPLGAVTGGTALVWHVVTGTVAALGHAFSPGGLSSLAHQVASPKAAAQAQAHGQGTVSAVGAAEYLADAARAGSYPFIVMLILLNISLGVLNMLPMLPLDGGHVAIALYEGGRSRRGRRYRADVTKLMPVAYTFMAFLLVFVVAKMYLDIAHGVQNPFG